MIDILTMKHIKLKIFIKESDLKKLITMEHQQTLRKKINRKKQKS